MQKSAIDDSSSSELSYAFLYGRHPATAVLDVIVTNTASAMRVAPPRRKKSNTDDKKRRLTAMHTNQYELRHWPAPLQR